MNRPAALQALGRLALIEGSSLIALVGIAMPLKYYAGIPEAVRIVGMAHGLLFLTATAVLILVMARGHLSPLKSLGVFIASLVPFAGLWSHSMLKKSAIEPRPAA